MVVAGAVQALLFRMNPSLQTLQVEEDPDTSACKQLSIPESTQLILVTASAPVPVVSLLKT